MNLFSSQSSEAIGLHSENWLIYHLEVTGEMGS